MDAEGRPRGVVDAHLHLWDPARLSIGWLSETPRLDRPVLLAEYAVAARTIGVDAAVIVEAAVDDDALEDEVAWIHELVAADGLVAAGVAGWRPGADPARTGAWLDRLASVPGVAGVREVLHPDGRGPHAPLEGGRIDAFGEAGRRGLVVDLCARPDQLEAVETAVRSVPDTTFVLDHLGRPRAGEPLDPAWRRAVDRLAMHSNLHVKVSALIECAAGAGRSASGFAPFISTVLAAFGPDRAIWGSNWPVCMDTAADLAWWFHAASRGIGEAEGDVLAAVLGGTARRVYGLTAD